MYQQGVLSAFSDGRKNLGFSRGYRPLLQGRKLQATPRLVWPASYQFVEDEPINVVCGDYWVKAVVTSVVRRRIADLTSRELKRFTPDCSTIDALVMTLNNIVAKSQGPGRNRVVTSHDEVDVIAFRYEE